MVACPFLVTIVKNTSSQSYEVIVYSFMKTERLGNKVFSKNAEEGKNVSVQDGDFKG